MPNANPTAGPPTGRISRAALEALPGWAARARDYTPDPAAIDAIRERAAGIEVLAFIATWCPDCLREVPRFLEIADRAGLLASQVTLYALERTMKDAEGLAVRWGIRAVPTFIFVQGGRELGRVVERPRGSLESDIARLLAG